MGKSKEMTEKGRKNVADGLARVLADTYTLYLKTHGFHWNVEGPLFPMLHAMFEEQYTELAGAVDQIAERIRALRQPAPAGYAAFAKLATIREASGRESATDMIRALAKDQETIAATARDSFAIAEAANDEATADLMVQRLHVHEKAAWMLRAMLA
jgi:starvation-inducible DNA-binding protein